MNTRNARNIQSSCPAQARHPVNAGSAMATGSPAFAGDDARRDHPALTPALRWMSNMICLWGFCDKAACRRAQRCKGDPRDCLARYAPLVPEDARAGVKCMLEGLRYGQSYDEVCEDVPDEVVAVEDWIARVDGSRANSLPSPGPPR